MTNYSLSSLRVTFGFTSSVDIISKKYHYIINLYGNSVLISNIKWKDYVKAELKPSNRWELSLFNLYIEIKKNNEDTLKIDVPESIREDIINDFDTFTTEEYIENLCKKENDRIAKEKELEEKENRKLVNEFFGIIQED